MSLLSQWACRRMSGTFLKVGAAAGALASCSLPIRQETAIAAEQEAIRAVERQRLRLLVTGDLEAAARLHADDFQLVNPVGRSFSKEEYFASLSSGFLDYVAWEPGPIEVRLEQDSATIRYRSQLQVSLGSQAGRRLPHWHMDYYERRHGRWQVVWSQATEIK